MHGVRRTVLEAQAAAAGLPLWIVPLPWPCSNEIYEERMAEVCRRAVAERIDAFAFGDLLCGVAADGGGAEHPVSTGGFDADSDGGDEGGGYEGGGGEE